MLISDTINAELYLRMLCAGAAALEAKKEEINRLNVFPVPDGDTGSNMFMTLDAVRTAKIPTSDLSSCAEAAAKAVMRAARGNSGVILSLFFRGAAKVFSGHQTADADLIVSAFRTGAQTARDAVLKPAEGTILTVMRECCAGDDYPRDDMIRLFGTLSDAAQETLKKTPEMLPALKRAKVVDSGGFGFTVVLSGMIRALCGEPVGETHSQDPETTQDADFSSYSDEEIRFGFCTECLANIRPDVTPAQIEQLREYLSRMGDSIVLVSDSEILKVHVHTNEPMMVLPRILQLGEPQLIKVENMRQQHHSLVETEEKTERVPYGIVAVANGDGFTDLFKELGAGVVIAGGQSMNPSANDFLKAIRRLRCEKAILLPNNSNVVLTALQAAELAEDVGVGVVKCTTVPQGLSAMLAFDPSASLKENLEAMNEQAKTVTTLSVTRAVKDARIGTVRVRKKQYIGLVDHDLVCSEDTAEDCLRALSGKIAGKETVTLFYGKGVKEEEAAQAAEILRESLGTECEVEVVRGRQPIYPFLISAE